MGDLECGAGEELCERTSRPQRANGPGVSEGSGGSSAFPGTRRRACSGSPGALAYSNGVQSGPERRLQVGLLELRPVGRVDAPPRSTACRVDDEPVLPGDVEIGEQRQRIADRSTGTRPVARVPATGTAPMCARIPRQGPLRRVLRHPARSHASLLTSYAYNPERCRYGRQSGIAYVPKRLRPAHGVACE